MADVDAHPRQYSDTLPASADPYSDSTAPAPAPATTTQMATPPVDDREARPAFAARSRSRSPGPERERFRGAPPRGGYRGDGPRRPTVSTCFVSASTHIMSEHTLYPLLLCLAHTLLVPSSLKLGA